jgi:hypothetical protein
MRWRSVLLTASSVVALAACGGGDGEQQVEQRTVTGPTIDRTIADGLATRSDKVATLLDSGDACGARDEAALLRADLTQAINDRAIPDLYLEDLSGLVNEIEAGIPACEEPQPPPPPDEDKEKKKDKGDGDD